MKHQLHVQKKASSTSKLTPANRFQSRPFDPPTEASPPQQMPDLQTQQENAERLGHNFANIPILRSNSSPPPIQPKLTIGQPGDKYEQEADAVASQVVTQINAPETVQREEMPEEGEELQMKSDSGTIQREEMPEEDEEELQMKSESGTIQREEMPEEKEEVLAPPTEAAPQQQQTPELQTQPNKTKPLGYNFANIPILRPNSSPPPIQPKLTIGQPGDKYEQEADTVARQVVNQMNSPETIQRQEMPEEEEELQMKSDSGTIQREEMPEEEEELQMKPMVQPQAEGGMAATPDLEASIQRARGGGQPLSDNIREPMEQAFGADFSGVRVHTDGTSDALNQSIQAKAFTTGQDVFFRQGAYQPGSRGGQELIAHELTHVVQQGGGAVRRSPDSRRQTNMKNTTFDSDSSVATDGVIQRSKISRLLKSGLLNPVTRLKLRNNLYENIAQTGIRLNQLGIAIANGQENQASSLYARLGMHGMKYANPKFHLQNAKIAAYGFPMVAVCYAEHHRRFKALAKKFKRQFPNNATPQDLANFFGS